MVRRPDDRTHSCSFCYKSENTVGHLIASPSEDGPRVYICDECIAVCHSILGDRQEQAAVAAIADEATVLSLLNALERWIRREAQGDAAAELAAVREIGARMFPERRGMNYQSGEDIIPGDRITYAGSPGYIDFVISESTGDAALDWHLKENPRGGVMIFAESCGGMFLPEPQNDEDLVLVSRKP
jgi:hypothetical protein